MLATATPLASLGWTAIPVIGLIIYVLWRFVFRGGND